LTIKTTRTIVSFNEPFSLRNVEGVQPAGSYAVCVEDELIEGLSHAARRRISTTIQIPSKSSSQEQSRLVAIHQTDLDAMLMKDLHLTL
jgi:hypothetical protein